MSLRSNALELLAELEIDPADVHRFQVLCLPENIEDKAASDLIDAEGAITLSKLLKEKEIACANSYDLGLKTKVSARRSTEYYLGCIWILEHAALPLVIGVVGRLIGEKIQTKWRGHGKAKVRANIKVIDGKVDADISFSGDADAFLKVFKGLDDG